MMLMIGMSTKSGIEIKSFCCRFILMETFCGADLSHLFTHLVDDISGANDVVEVMMMMVVVRSCFSFIVF